MHRVELWMEVKTRARIESIRGGRAYLYSGCSLGTGRRLALPHGDSDIPTHHQEMLSTLSTLLLVPGSATCLLCLGQPLPGPTKPIPTTVCHDGNHPWQPRARGSVFHEEGQEDELVHIPLAHAPEDSRRQKQSLVCSLPDG